MNQDLDDTPCRLVVEYDGCIDDSDKPVYRGRYAACCKMAAIKWNRYTVGKQGLAIVSEETGRCLSFVARF